MPHVYLGCVHKEFLCQEHCLYNNIKQSSFSIFLSPCPLALPTPARDWGLGLGQQEVSGSNHGHGMGCLMLLFNMAHNSII